MRLTCPGCGATGSPELFSNESDARACFSELAKLAPNGVGEKLLEYLTLFRPAKRALTWKRARKLLDQLLPMIKAQQVTYRGKSSPASPQLFVEAMSQMLNMRERLQLPMENHNYLLSIVAGTAPGAASAAEAAAEELKRVAASQRHGSRSLAVAELASEIAARKRLKQPDMTDAERAAFMRERGFEP